MVDASDFGIGAVLAHKVGSHDRPIAFASKLLSSAQRNYSQIEKEALALVFGVTKFHDFLYGRHFTIITDHKPLTSLFHPTKPVPPRTAQKFIRWSIFLSQYRYDILYRSTAKHGNADALSRLPVAEDKAFDSSELACMFIDSETDEVVESFPIDFRRVATATAADPVLATVLRFVATQWPLSKSRIEDPLVRRFFAHKERLFVRRGVLLLRSDNDQSRVVVPRSLQSSVLRLLHQGHWGIVRTKQLARQHCTWFGIDAAITNMCSSCPACAEQQSAPPRKVFAWPKATSPWQRLHIDFAGPFWNARWLVLVDAFSNFPFVVRMSSTTSSATIQALSAIFCIEGLPQTIVSDNGPQFMSAEFQSFCQANGIQHLTSAPFSPQSNGAAERLVRTFKSQMLKLKESHSREDALLLFLSSYRSQPRDRRSPAELLHGRPHRTLMSLLHPPHQVPVQRQTPAFAPGDVVFYRNYRGSRRWLAGRILRCLGRAMYLVLGASGEVRRHLNQLRLCRRSGSAAPRLLSATVPSGQRPGDPSTGSPHPQVLPTMPSILPHGDAPPPPQQQQPPPPPPLVLPPAPPAFDASLQPPSASQGHAPPIASRDQLSSAMELPPAPDHMPSSRVGYPDAMEVDPSVTPVSLRAHTPHVDVHPGLVFQAFPSSPRTVWPGAGGTASPVVRLPTSSHTSTCGPPHGGRKPYHTTVRRFAGEECGVTARHHTC
ncbi:uncharacterized protein K02A2.6-like [Schistocerca serialis cubense]|uniref:uncharacterized protein K02A2.6-like n=1 Tax=Schistocerca serialis cubense TaxID=2023355 RepID=UPI00214F4DF1|nr:uncharacterized protein K02A2.6-like [Schistocerca serialis cubense]XP_049952222.1 uncharacterized protein K02A2.6-like [Schistocerca serialis cubense]XP_049952223.1 uncharacterized protein K02A2.6-like [Schistocerca serialis cubense]